MIVHDNGSHVKILETLPFPQGKYFDNSYIKKIQIVENQFGKNYFFQS